MANPFTKHPNSQNETYLQHMKIALSFALIGFAIGFCALVHGFFPFLCTQTTSKLFMRLQSMIQTRQL